MGGTTKNVQRAAAEVRPKWQTEAHEKVSNKSLRGVYKFPDVWYNSIVILGRGRYTTRDRNRP
jgi:hypothetical protein